jgi:hypothetical protein
MSSLYIYSVRSIHCAAEHINNPLEEFYRAVRGDGAA